CCRDSNPRYSIDVRGRHVATLLALLSAACATTAARRDPLTSAPEIAVGSGGAEDKTPTARVAIFVLFVGRQEEASPADQVSAKNAAVEAARYAKDVSIVGQEEGRPIAGER